MSVISKPVLANYSSYGDYSLATVGYALLSGSLGGVASCVDRHVGFSFGDGCDPAVVKLIGGCACNTRRSCGSIHGRHVSVGCVCDRVDNHHNSVNSVNGFGVGLVEGLLGEHSTCEHVVSGVNERGVHDDGVACGDSNKAFEKLDDSINESASKLVGNVERNRKWRQEKKIKKQKRKEMNVDWRHGPVSKVEDEEKRSFFAECDDATRKKLRESRAKLFIARNEREVLQEKRMLDRLESPEDLVKDIIRITAMANRLKKQAKDSKVGGWAETVADSLTKSIANSAPSSVPSLESVGYGKSALKSSDGDGEPVKSLRQLEFETVLHMVEKDYELKDAYSLDEYNNDIATVKRNYQDVAYTEIERHTFEIEKKISERLLRFGVSSEIVELAIEDYKNDY